MDAGEIKRAREEAGLSLADVAGQELSRAAIHRVEQGKVRPSMRTLRLIADRTGQPIDRFLLPDGREPSLRALESEIELARIERLVVRDDAPEALARIKERLDEPAGRQVTARLRYLAGRCQLRMSKPLAALGELGRARAEFEAMGDVRSAVECLVWEAAALGMEEDPTALERAREALRRCREVDPVPREAEAQILSTLGGIYLTRHDWDRAAAAYESAAQAAGQIKGLDRLAHTYDGLSLALQGSGDLLSALKYAHLALGLSSIQRNQLHLARTENNLGLLLVRMGRWQEAEWHLRESLRHCEEGGITTGRCHVLLSFGELCFHRGDLAAAERAVKEAIERAESSGERLTLALAWQWLGRVQTKLDRDHDADRCFVTAITMLRELDARHRLAECHADYAQVLDGRGDLQRSVNHWRAASQLWHPSSNGIHTERDLTAWA